MTYKQAKQIIESEDISIEKLREAQIVVQNHEKTKKKDLRSDASMIAYKKWMRKNKETTELKNEIKKYWV